MYTLHWVQEIPAKSKFEQANLKSGECKYTVHTKRNLLI